MKNITKIILLSIVMLLLCSGCDLFQKNNDHLMMDKPALKITEDIDKTVKTINEETKKIDEKTESISENAQEIYDTAVIIQPKLPEESKKEIDPHLETIKKDSKSIIKDTQEITEATMAIKATEDVLEGTKEEANKANKALTTLIKDNEKLKEELKEAKEAKNSQLHRTLQWIIAGCVVGCGAFIVLFFFTGSKGGLLAAGGCGLVLVIAIFVDMYIAWLAIGGGVLLLAMVGWLLYNIYVKNKAFNEVVDTVEVTKDNMTDEDVKKVFGEDGQTGIMDSIQSPETIALVKKAKSGIGGLWSYAKNKKTNGDTSNEDTLIVETPA